MFQKDTYFRSKKITQSARGQSCTMRLQGCRNETETVVFAHAPSRLKGTGIKSPDFHGGYLCYHCHVKSDTEATCEDWLRCIFETQLIWIPMLIKK